MPFATARRFLISATLPSAIRNQSCPPSHPSVAPRGYWAQWWPLIRGGNFPTL